MWEMKVDYRTFVNTLEDIAKTHHNESNIPDWSSRSIFAQLVDIWGEANKVVTIHKVLSNKSPNNLHKLLPFIEAFRNMCLGVYLNPNVSRGAKVELRVSE